VLHVPHSTFEGEYPAAISRAEARRALGVSPDDAVIAMVGALRPYRGAERLLDALAEFEHTAPSPLLLLGGRVNSDPRMTEVLHRARLSPRVIASEHALDAETLSLWMSAADIAAMPYESILNSGTFGLALTFGLPVVAPRRELFSTTPMRALCTSLTAAVRRRSSQHCGERSTHARSRHARVPYRGWPPSALPTSWRARLRRRSPLACNLSTSAH